MIYRNILNEDLKSFPYFGKITFKLINRDNVFIWALTTYQEDAPILTLTNKRNLDTTFFHFPYKDGDLD